MLVIRDNIAKMANDKRSLTKAGHKLLEFHTNNLVSTFNNVIRDLMNAIRKCFKIQFPVYFQL